MVNRNFCNLKIATLHTGDVIDNKMIKEIFRICYLTIAICLFGNGWAQQTWTSGEMINLRPTGGFEFVVFYKDCENIILVDIKGVTDYSNITFNIKDGKVIQDNVIKNRITVSPSAPHPILYILQNKKIIDSVAFSVRMNPPPVVELQLNEKAINLTNATLKKESIDNLRLVVICIEEWRMEFFPNDFNFKITESTLKFYKNQKLVGIGNLSEDGQIQIDKDILKKSDKLVIQVTDLKRINFNGDLISRKFPKFNHEFELK